MPRRRVLIVDDSVVIRRLLSDAIGADPACEVAGVAASGKIALAKIPQCNPDIVTLDVEMPDMDGLETVVEIRKLYPRLPVIMFSSLTERAASATLKALALGASDYVTKPSASSVAGALERVRAELIPKILELCARRDPASLLASRSSLASRPSAVRPAVTSPAAAPRSTQVEIVAIGASTGGPNALAVVIAALAGNFPVPIVITQHMPPLFTRLLSERLNTVSALTVHEAQGGELLLPGHVYIAQGDYHLALKREGVACRTVLNQAPPENSCRPAVDVMFRSVVEAYGGRVLAVVLTGMGQDGLRGCELVREAGGQIVVQDEASSVVWGMPGFVAKAGLADAIVPIEDVTTEIEMRVRGAARAALRPMTPSAPRPER